MTTSDVSGLTLKYCIVGILPGDSTEIDNLISKCSYNSNIIDNVVQLNNTWITLANEINHTLNTSIYNVEKTFDITTEMAELKNYTDIKFYVFVKNAFEEYNNKLNEYEDNLYKLNREVILNANGGRFYDGKGKVSLIVRYNTSFEEVLDNNSLYKNPSRASEYVLEGWTSGGQSYSNNSDLKITKDMEFSAKWYQYCSGEKTYVKESSCSASCGGGTKTIYYNDKKYPSHSCNTTQACNTQVCTTKPSGGEGSCKNYWDGNVLSTTDCKNIYGVNSWYTSNQNCYGTTNPRGAGCCHTICN